MWWQDQVKSKGLWGSSAGASLKGYGVDSTEKNPDMIICVPSVAGFLPYSEEAKLDLRRY